jgi:hypothetical protein
MNIAASTAEEGVRTADSTFNNCLKKTGIAICLLQKKTDAPHCLPHGK